MTILNLSWDLFSDILVTLLGLLVFKEPHTNRELLGLFFAFIAIFLFATDKDAIRKH
jgi:drug/metabolite transporter (DMT)-like permease